MKTRLSVVGVAGALLALGIVWLVLAAGGSRPAQAATVTVNIGNNWYSNSTSNDCGSPCVTNIGVGDTVHWNWLNGSPNHSTTSDNGSGQVWDSGQNSSPFTFDETFSTPGSYSYHCNVHASMHGTIVVSPTPTATPSFRPVLTPTPTRTTPTPAGLVGDANKDGHVDAVDAAIVLQYAAGLVAYINPRADANGDGQVNAIDAQLILQYDAGLIHILPGSPTPTVTATPDPLLHRPSVYWVECMGNCGYVFHPAMSCQRQPPEVGLAIRTLNCTTTAGWEMTCSVTYNFSTGDTVDCSNSQDGQFGCTGGAYSGTCNGNVWFGACSSSNGVSPLHCWRTDANGTETVDCSETDVGSYSCTWNGVMSFSCHEDVGLWSCAPSRPTPTTTPGR